MDNTSHLGGQGLDELVPSRYALQVGEIDVLVISDGVLPISAETIAYNADSADLAAWLDDMFLPPDVLEWPLNVVVVRSGGRTILIDAVASEGVAGRTHRLRVEPAATPAGSGCVGGAREGRFDRHAGPPIDQSPPRT